MRILFFWRLSFGLEKTFWWSNMLRVKGQICEKVHHVKVCPTMEEYGQKRKRKNKHEFKAFEKDNIRSSN